MTTARDDEHRDRDDRDRREPRHHPCGEVPALAAREHQRGDEEREPAGPRPRSRDVRDVGDERDRTGDARMPGRSRGHDEIPREAITVAAGSSNRGVRRRRRPRAHREPRLHDQSRPKRVSSTADDGSQRRRREPEPPAAAPCSGRPASATTASAPRRAELRQAQPEAPAHAVVRERMRSERGGTADEQEQQGESRKRAAVKRTVTGARRPRPRTSAATPAGFAPGLPDVEDERAVTGCASAEITRHVTVYVPRPAAVSPTATASPRVARPAVVDPPGAWRRTRAPSRTRSRPPR